MLPLPLPLAGRSGRPQSTIGRPHLHADHPGRLDRFHPRLLTQPNDHLPTVAPSLCPKLVRINLIH